MDALVFLLFTSYSLKKYKNSVMKDNFSNIGYSFKDSSLIELALTHKSFSSSNNERLEFLGDALINLYISERLFKTYDGLDEGKLTRFKASMVSRDNLNLIASKLNIGSLIKLGRGEKLEGNSILGNTFEALIGAVFLDSDYSKTQIVLDNLFDGDFFSIVPQAVLARAARGGAVRPTKNGAPCGTPSLSCWWRISESNR